MGENRFQKLDPSLTEEAMIKQEEETFAQNNPEDSAAFLYKTYSPQYRGLIKRMPRKALERLAIHLVEGALSETVYKPTTNQESAAYVLGDKLLQARWVMQLHTLSSAAQELEKARIAATEQTASLAPPPGSIPLSEILQTPLEPAIIEDTNSNQGENNNG